MTADFPITLGICLDGEAIWLGRKPENAKRPVLQSHGAFEIHEGLKPVLALLDDMSIKATFFVPGLTADRYPDAVREIVRRGHEVGSHGHGHKPIQTLTPEQEEHELVAGMESIRAITGKMPNIWRSPSWEWSDRTLDLLLKHGVTVSTNFHDRLRPYRHMKDGKPTPVVELPVQWHMADAPFFSYGGEVGRVVRPAIDAEQVWREEFDGLYDWEGTFYHLTLHVQLIGHPGRLRMVARHLAYMKSHARSRFMTAGEIAATVA
ncbi:MAG: polysaccharide deacetylase family protein [Hyphomicrobiaceae bacterium]|jgi:peptidoglycan/xylan/chitin deacetylase (PgdA/CDA1 family)